MTDSKYFTTTKKGEIFELKSELNSEKKEKKKEAVKKVIASMTVGKDVSALFPDVVNCMQTDNLELKKLVYLYLMNYAKSQPDMAIMAVNTFVKVCLLPKFFYYIIFVVSFSTREINAYIHGQVAAFTIKQYKLYLNKKPNYRLGSAIKVASYSRFYK